MPRVQGMCSGVWAAWGAGEVCGTGRGTSLGVWRIAVGRLGGIGVRLKRSGNVGYIQKGRGGLSQCVWVAVKVVGQWWASWDGGCMWGTRRVAAGRLGGAGVHVGNGCGGGGIGAGGAGCGETESQKPGMVVAAPESWLLMLEVLVLMKQQVYLCCP